MISRVEHVLPEEAFRRLSCASAFVFDVDRTLTEPHSKMSRTIVDELLKLRVPSGVATARSLSELEESLPIGSSLGEIFKGCSLLEDGHVLLPGGQARGALLTIEALVPVEALEAISRFRKLLEESIVDLGRIDGFGQFAGVPEPLVKLPPHRDFLATVTLWEKGAVGHPSFIHAYNWCCTRLRDLSLDSQLTLTEVGDGTLRVTVRGFDKGQGLNQLASRNRLDLSNVAYFGDGFNDVPAAEAVKARGGLVVAIGSSTPPLLKFADYVTNGDGPNVVERLLKRLNSAR